MTKVTYLVVSLATIFGSLVIASPAHADFEGRMNFSEFIWIDDEAPTSNTQAEVDEHCNCSGIVAKTFTRNDNPAKRVHYLNSDLDIVKVWYVKRDDDRYHAYNKVWCNSNGCLSTKA